MKGLEIIVRKHTNIFENNPQEGPSVMLRSAIRFLHNLVIAAKGTTIPIMIKYPAIYGDILKIIAIDYQGESEYIYPLVKVIRESARADNHMLTIGK